MAKPHEKPGVTGRWARLRTKPVEGRTAGLAGIWMGLAMTLCAGSTLAQSVAPIPLPPQPQNNDAQEQRRAQDRDRALRERQERDVDVRLSGKPEEAPAHLPTSEAPCFLIREIDIRVPGGESKSTAAQFRGYLDAASGADKTDAPMGRCLGAEGVSLVIKRVQNAVIARGYITTRVLAEPQDLQGGVLTLTVIPGRIHAIRFAEVSDRRGNAWSALPAQSGDLLNLRDIEQALENFKRVPTAEADIQIEPASGPAAQPGQSDLVISYRQPFPFRLSVSADDSGSKSTGRYQCGALFQGERSVFKRLDHGTPCEKIHRAPKRPTVSSTHACTDARDDTSVSMQMAEPPAPRMEAATGSPVSARRAAMTTFAPSEARRRAIPSPTP